MVRSNQAVWRPAANAAYHTLAGWGEEEEGSVETMEGQKETGKRTSQRKGMKKGQNERRLKKMSGKDFETLPSCDDGA